MTTVQEVCSINEVLNDISPMNKPSLVSIYHGRDEQRKAVSKDNFEGI